MTDLSTTILGALRLFEGATLAELVQLTDADYFVVHHELRRLRGDGLVAPPLRDGIIGRPAGKPITYTLAARRPPPAPRPRRAYGVYDVERSR